MPAAWHADPTGRHQHRYWDGAQWTEHVANNGAQGVDPVATTPATRRDARLQQATPEVVVEQSRPTFAQRRAAAKEARVLQREAELARKQEERDKAEALRLQQEEAQRIARATAEARAQRQAEEREWQRQADLAREREAAEAEAREIREAQEREAQVYNYPPFYLPEYNRYTSTEVAGEFARIDAIHKLLRRKPKLDEEIVNDALLAALVPEPSNPYDRNAVKVVIGGHHVGYLEREDAAAVQPAIRRIVEAGHLPTVSARVWAVARHDYDNGRKLRHYANVRLALASPDALLPLNDPPFEAHSIIPWSGTLQVTGEEDHQQQLAEYATGEGAALVIGTLAIIQRGTMKAPKELIEIRIDGERVGQLTPTTSQHFIPTVQHLEAQGMTTAVWLRVTGSAIAAQVTIHATRAHELPTDWFSTPHTAPRLYGTAPRAINDGALDDAEIRAAARREPMWED